MEEICRLFRSTVIHPFSELRKRPGKIFRTSEKGGINVDLARSPARRSGPELSRCLRRVRLGLGPPGRTGGLQGPGLSGGPGFVEAVIDQ